MHTADVKQNDSQKEIRDDGPSVLGRFTWTVVGNTCIPCLLKNNGTKYVSVRIAESKVLGHFLHRLNVEVFNCVSVKSFGITEAENKLLNEINSKHCDYAFGRDPFSIDSDFIVKLDDLIEFYNFMDTCYNKLLLQTPANNKNNKCGFVRINADSVVPYAVKNDQKYVPLFYFEGETESLKTKAINLENWDLAYLKFCCKVQGIKNELFASEQCLVTSLEDVKSYFPEGTKFDDYWPSKVVEMQTPARNDLNGNHSWVQTPHIDSSTVPQSVPNATHSIANKSIPSALSKQLHNNQRINTTAVINNISGNVPGYQQGNSWPTTVMGNTANTVQSNSYQIPNQARIAQKQTPATMHSMTSNATVPPRSYVNQTVRPHQPQYYSTAPVSVPNVPGATQPPPPLVRVSSSNTIPNNAYSNTISGDTYSHIYNNTSSLPALYSMTVPTRHVNTSSSQVTNKVRNTVPNQTPTSNVTRFPPALTPINGNANTIQTNVSAVSVNNIPNNVGNVMIANRQHRTNYNQTGGEIIDLSSPPHSPQHTNVNTVNRISSSASNGYSYNKSSGNTSLPPLIFLNDQSSNKNGVPPFKIQTVRLIDKSVQAINLKPYVDGEYVIPLQDVVNLYFPRVEINKLRQVLQNVLNIGLFKGTPTQIQMLREHHKGKPLDNDVPLILVKDFESHYPQLTYMEHSMTAERDNIERDAKRQKIS